jgi:hypothetical protein
MLLLPASVLDASGCTQDACCNCWRWPGRAVNSSGAARPGVSTAQHSRAQHSTAQGQPGQARLLARMPQVLGWGAREAAAASSELDQHRSNLGRQGQPGAQRQEQL